MLYKDFLKHFLETDSGGNNFSFFLYKSEKGGKEDLSEAESERAKIELMKVSGERRGREKEERGEVEREREREIKCLILSNDK